MYLDTSAMAKLVVEEPESAALRRAIEAAGDVCTSIVGRIEFERVVRRHVDHPDGAIDAVLELVEIIPLNVANATIAAVVKPSLMKSLDAIHLATVIELRDDIDSFCCYDTQLAAAARDYGVPVVAPR